MALDPTAQFILNALAQQGVKSFEQIGVENARAVIDTFPTLQNPPENVKHVENRDLDGVPMRIYTPADLNLGVGQGTDLCPFDCQCCF